MVGGCILFFVLFYTSVGAWLSLSFDFPFFQVSLEIFFFVNLPRELPTQGLVLMLNGVAGAITSWLCANKTKGNCTISHRQQDEGKSLAIP